MFVTPYALLSDFFHLSCEMSITLLAVLGLFLVSVASEIPADWAGRHQLGHLLYSPVPTTGTLNATVGNGYVATSVYSDTIYISGLFNGDSDVTPSHRYDHFPTINFRAKLHCAAVNFFS